MRLKTTLGAIAVLTCGLYSSALAGEEPGGGAIKKLNTDTETGIGCLYKYYPFPDRSLFQDYKARNNPNQVYAQFSEKIGALMDPNIIESECSYNRARFQALEFVNASGRDKWGVRLDLDEFEKTILAFVNGKILLSKAKLHSMYSSYIRINDLNIDRPLDEVIKELVKNHKVKINLMAFFEATQKNFGIDKDEIQTQEIVAFTAWYGGILR